MVDEVRVKDIWPCNQSADVPPGNRAAGALNDLVVPAALTSNVKVVGTTPQIVALFSGLPM